MDMHDKHNCDDSECDVVHPSRAKEKKIEIIDGYTIKYHANGKSRWSKGKIIDGKTDGYWEWYRPDGTLKRSGNFKMGEAVGEWITYDSNGKTYKTTHRGNN